MTKSPRLIVTPSRLRGLLEIGGGDGVAVFQLFLAERARHVEEDAAADHLVLGLLDAALLRAGGGHLAAVVAVPHVVLVEDVAEPVPLGAGLQRHHHDVVGRADAALVEHAGIGVGTGAQHQVQRIDASHRRVVGLAALRTELVEVERERDHLALLHELRRRDDVLGARVVERADLVVRAPLAPVLVLLRRVAKVLAGELALSHGASFFKGWEAPGSGRRARRAPSYSVSSRTRQPRVADTSCRRCPTLRPIVPVSSSSARW